MPLRAVTLRISWLALTLLGEDFGAECLAAGAAGDFLEEDEEGFAGFF